jgi:hypothetical protein
MCGCIILAVSVSGYRKHLLELWREVHPGAPLQLQLPFVMKTSGNCTQAITHEKVIGRLRQVEVVQVRSQFIGRL